MPFTVGETVGPYRILQQLGQGGMATVFKAYHAALDRYVALKVLHPAFTEDPNFLARFQREARLVARLEHPNIVPIYDYAEYEGRPYLVMKFIEGETLKARLGRSRLEPSEVAQIVEAVGAALSYAHKHGVLHRDVKPSNVLLGQDGQIYLADFGLARIAQSGESTLTSDMILGTPQYISPEQAVGKKELNEGTDIYSFGVMLYELVVGRVPFSADTPFSIIHDHIYSPLPPPTQLNADVPPAVERVLLKALAKDPNDRYLDVPALVTAFLEAWKEAWPSGTHPAAPAGATAVSAPASTTQRLVQTEPPRPETAHPQVPGTTPFVPPVAAVTAASTSPRVRRISWMWLAVAVIFFLCCIFTFLALRGNRQVAFSQQATASAVLTPVVAETLAHAIEQADQNPNDPSAQLRLAAAYVEAGMSDMAGEAMTRALEVGARDEQFLWDACRQMESHQAWLLAARACVAGAEMHRQVSIDLPPDLKTILHEVLFRAAIDADLSLFLPAERLAEIDEPMARLVEVRHRFFTGDQQGAQDILDRLLAAQPEMPEAILLQAEFMAEKGQGEDALRLLGELEHSPGVSDWIRQEMARIRTIIP
jgi:tetratricopeptide (TPR) repeat protein